MVPLLFSVQAVIPDPLLDVRNIVWTPLISSTAMAEVALPKAGRFAAGIPERTPSEPVVTVPLLS